MAKALTPQKLKFVELFVGECAGNGAKAAELAGWSKTSAKVIASRLLKSKQIQDAIVNRKAALVNQVEEAVNRVEQAAAVIERRGIMSGDEAMERLSLYARADIGQVLGPDDPIAQLPPEIRMCIKSIRPSRYGRSIELYDAMKATELLAKSAGKLKEIVQVESLEQLIAKSMQPAEAVA